VAQIPPNRIHAPNFMRSATAPAIRATVIVANIAWKAANAITG